GGDGIFRRQALPAGTAQEGEAQRIVRRRRQATRCFGREATPMTVKRDVAERFSLSRWSRRKLQSAALGPGSNPPAVPAVAPPHLATAGTSAVKAAAPVDLPPIESLCFDSDFTAFLRPEVDETLKRAALK